jgi:uncharacterized protein (DUF1778 family)
VEFVVSAPGQRNLLERAARLNCEGVATFARRAALEAARTALEAAQVQALIATRENNEPLVFKGAAAEQLDELLENPPPQTEYLRESRRLLAEMKARTGLRAEGAAGK